MRTIKHLGDICKINGAEIEPVDVITGGSPCQDLSVAGKRAGLKGERSGLFMEQIRVVKEMRDADRQSGRTGEFIRPRWLVWENVPGALSSGKDENGIKGEDFRCVLEEVARVIQEDAVIPGPPKEGWHTSGCILLDSGSIAWAIHDAQWWGVPQRRKRIALVADFNGFDAPKVLFDPSLRGASNGADADYSVGHIGRGSGRTVQPLSQGMQGNSVESGEAWETTSGDTEEGS